MIKLGLVGKNISHSKSQSVYEDLLSQEISYKLLDYQNEDDIPSLEYILKELDGLSITAPYKKHFVNKVKIESDVAELGIINCIKKTNGSFIATNTDYLAVKSFLLNDIDLSAYDVLLLGDGSMAEITLYLFKKMGWPLRQTSRKLDSKFSELNLVHESQKSDKELLVINSCGRSFNYTGPLGQGILFWDFNYLHNFHINRLKESSIAYIDGMDLLRNQARFALQFWGITH